MARLFTAANSDGLVVNAAPFTAVPFTMACWFRQNDVTGNYGLMFVGDKDVTNHRIQLHTVGSVAGDPVRFFIQAGGTNNSLDTTAGFSANTWHHACAVAAADNDRTVYLDGGNSASTAVSVIPSGEDRVSIGFNGDSTPEGYFDGRIAEAAIWNVALTAAQVALLARGVSPLRIRPDTLIAYWPLYGNASPEPNYAQGTTTFNLTVTGAVQADHAPSLMAPFGFDLGWMGAFKVAAAVTAPGGGFQHLWHGFGDPGVSVTPQTLHTIEQGISA